MSRRILVFASLVTSTLFALVAATPAAAASSIDYVALGDSYSSGLGSPGESGLCGQSPNGYPGLWAAANHPASYRLVACSGATTDTLRATQLSALDSRADLVSLTIGGNDAGFAPAVLTCTVVDDSACASTVDVALSYIAHVMGGKLAATYADIRHAAPKARVVVLGYPVLFDTSSASCPGGMSLAKRITLDRGVTALNSVIEARAGTAGFAYADVTATFAGHGICSPNPYVHSLMLLPPTDSFHPTASGYRYGYLPALTTAAA